MQSEALLTLAAAKADELKAEDIVKLDVRERSSITEYMLICTGTSKRHTQSIAEHIATEAKHQGVAPLGIEGMDDGEWVLVDLGDVIVHVMQEQTRDFYQLEKLWGL